MILSVQGNKISGHTDIIASKSVLHRQLICAALCNEPTVIMNTSSSSDIDATKNCLTAFAIDCSAIDNGLIIAPHALNTDRMTLLNCRESGSTFRFLLPVIAALGQKACFIGSERLAQRPIGPLADIIVTNGCSLSELGIFPLKIGGKLKAESFTIRGDISSQYISGLLMAAPMLGHECHIYITGKIESEPYIDMTVAVMQQFGIDVQKVNNDHYMIPKGSKYSSPGLINCEGDWSNAAFWLVAAAISNSCDFTLGNLNMQSLQGDKAIVELLQNCGAEMAFDASSIRITSAGDLHTFEFDAAQTPDMVPIAAVLAAACHGRSTIYNAERLIYKESNRLQSVYDMLNALGADIEVTADGLIIYGSGKLYGGRINSANDHRIAMSAAAAAMICESEVIIEQAEAADKSYPDFYDKFSKRGMNICQLSE